MKIFIMRHGEAEHFAASDAERVLTSRGISESVTIAQICRDKGITAVDLALVSPYVRAQQTWQQVQTVLTASEVETCHDITPYGQAESVFDYLCARIEIEQPQSLLLISHLPLVGYLTAEFVSELPAPMFSTSSMVCIEFEPESRQSELLWHLYP